MSEVIDRSAFVCRVPGCGGPRSGVCINKLSFQECPDVIPVEDAVNGAASTSDPEPTAQANRSMTATSEAASLDVRQCDRLLRERGAVLVAIAAGPETGKTTMIATIYELLHRDRLAGYRFGGSETLRGLEERCFLARIGSNGANPDTPRTPFAAQLSFAHLRVSTVYGIRDLIFSDRSGEYFDNVVDQPARIGEFIELTRADIVLLLVDLHDLEATPHVCVSYARRLFMAMDQGEVLSGKTVCLVGTKADKLKGEDALERANAALSDLAADLSRRSKGKIDVVPLVTASRRRSENGKIGEGLVELMRYVVKEDASRTFSLTKVLPAEVRGMDELMFPYWSERS